MPRRVLVPVDGSNFAEHALPYALGIARRTGASLHLALVHVPSDAVSPAYPLARALEERALELRDREAEYLGSVVERLSPAGVEVKPALLQGRVAPAICDHLEEAEIGLVVMTTHGRGGLQRAWLGSTADAVVRHSMIPVLLVRPTQDTREIDAESDRPLRRILASLDGSETAEVALRDAVRLGLSDDADIHLIHVVQPSIPAATPYVPDALYLTAEEREAREAQMRRYLEEVGERPWIGGRSVHVRVTADYLVAPAILEAADAVDADLIVLGTHGRGGLRRLILGSVADKVIRGTSRPVLVHRGVGRIARLLHGPESESD